MGIDEPLGLKRRTVIIRAYDERWPLLYDEEAAQIRAVLGEFALDVQHVGSTSVMGLAAKPILDIAVGVAALSDVERCKVPLAAIGYEYAYWAGVDDNHVFGKGIERTHLIHVVEFGSDIWKNYIKFRDALRANEELRRKYESLKTELAIRFAKNRAAYTDAKGEFIQRVLAGNNV